MPIRKVGSDTPIRQRHDRVGGPSVAAYRGEDTQHDAEDQRDKPRHRGEFQCRGQAFGDDLGHGPPLPVGDAQIALHRRGRGSSSIARRTGRSARGSRAGPLDIPRPCVPGPAWCRRGRPRNGTWRRPRGPPPAKPAPIARYVDDVAEHVPCIPRRVLRAAPAWGRGQAFRAGFGGPPPPPPPPPPPRSAACPGLHAPYLAQRSSTGQPGRRAGAGPERGQGRPDGR